MLSIIENKSSDFSKGYIAGVDLGFLIGGVKIKKYFF